MTYGTWSLECESMEKRDGAAKRATKPTKQPKMKPVKAWALKDKDGLTGCVYPSRDIAKFFRDENESIVRVLITEVAR